MSGQPLSSPAPGLRPKRLRLAGVCIVCDAPLAKGADAIHDPVSRTVRCVECPSTDQAPAANSIDAGIAGGSARRDYERRKGGRDARVKERFGTRLGGRVLALTEEPQSTRAWKQGARGEEALAAALADLAGVVVLHDRRVPVTRGNIDHVVIAPAGVFVVDAKHYKGMIQIRDKGGLFRTDRRLYVGSRDCSALAEGMGWQVAAVEAVLAAAAVEPPPAVTPVLCFIDGEWPLFRAPDSLRGVRLESPRTLRKLLTAAAVIDADAGDRLGRALSVALPPQ